MVALSKRFHFRNRLRTTDFSGDPSTLISALAEVTAVGGTAAALPSLIPDGIDLPDVMAAIEKEYYEESLRIADGNESRAARSLNVSRDTFRYRRKKLFG